MPRKPHSRQVERQQVSNLTELVSSADISEERVREFAVECYKLGIDYYRNIAAKVGQELARMTIDGQAKAGIPITLEEAKSDVSISKEFNAMLLRSELERYAAEGTVVNSSISNDIDSVLKKYKFSDQNYCRLRLLGVNAFIQGYTFSGDRFKYATRGKQGHIKIELSRAENCTRVSVPIGYDELVLDRLLTKYVGS